MTPTQGEHAQTAPGYEHQRAIMEGERNASLALFDHDGHLTLAEERLYESAFTNGWDRHAAVVAPTPATMSPANRLVAYSAATRLRELGFEWDATAEAWLQPSQPAAPQGVAYAELPEFEELDDDLIDLACSTGALYRVDFRRAWEVVREGLRASHGQAPAGAAVGVVRWAAGIEGSQLEVRWKDSEAPPAGTQVYAQTPTAQAAPAAGAVAGSAEPTQEMIAAVLRLVDLGQSDPEDHRYDDGSKLATQICRAVLAAAPTPAAQADSQPAPQGETNVQLDTDSNSSAPGQQRDVAGSVALGQPMGNGQDQAAGHSGAQGDKLLTVAERNIRSFLRSAVFKSESDREAALSCVDVLRDAARAPADSVLEDAARVYELVGYINRGIEYHNKGKTIFHIKPTQNLKTRWWTPDIAVYAASKQGADHA